MEPDTHFLEERERKKMKLHCLEENGERLVKVFPNRRIAEAECERLIEESEKDCYYGVTVDEVKPLAWAPDRFLALSARVRKVTREMFFGGCRQLFDANPRLQSFGWCQYMPVIDVVGEGWTRSGWYTFDWYIPGEEPLEEELQNQVKRFLFFFQAYTHGLSRLFGDSVQVSVYRDGTIETEFYHPEGCPLCPDCRDQVLYPPDSERP